MTIPSLHPVRALLFAFCMVLLAVPAAWAQQVPQSSEQIKLSFAPVAKRAMPAVVNIYTRKVVRTAQPLSPLFNDPFFRHFFGDRMPMGIPEDRIQRSLGSGVIVNGDGLVVTNHHVVAGSDEITVVLSDRREFEAQLVGSDERTDLAVLRINTRGETLPVLPIGDSDQLEVGDLVLAIGNPFGVGQTVTSGIVSAVARTSIGVGDFRSFIQTDAAINPGNSGGALVDMNGNLVGINTAIYTRNGGSNGIGFAIPTPMVKAVIAGITEDGKVVRPWLGATGQDITSEMVSALDLKRPMGVLINGLYPGGPAEKAGMQVGDVVVAVNGREISDPESLRFRLATLPVGEDAALTVLRQGRERVLQVKLVAPPDNPPRDMTEIKGRNPFSGTVVANLNPALAEELGLQTIEQGVIITRIARGTVAARLQFRPGDIILRINDAPVNTVADLRRALSTARDAWKITMRREGEVFSLTVGG
ncbi:DegQ family serine endoprotease [Telmatospirillum sp. J64-1]|uniref:DegQ family serine endoprotease n=1 Tax=Telmatospirillum sp. J64-1 TaxID=2502183 RepID=UPI00115DF603|nr:DegQ family serine endoprotease [Telmatospirillum sp. J64-1]